MKDQSSSMWIIPPCFHGWADGMYHPVGKPRGPHKCPVQVMFHPVSAKDASGCLFSLGDEEVEEES